VDFLLRPGGLYPSFGIGIFILPFSGLLLQIIRQFIQAGKAAPLTRMRVFQRGAPGIQSTLPDAPQPKKKGQVAAFSRGHEHLPILWVLEFADALQDIGAITAGVASYNLHTK